MPPFVRILSPLNRGLDVALVPGPLTQDAESVVRLHATWHFDCACFQTSLPGTEVKDPAPKCLSKKLPSHAPASGKSSVYHFRYSKCLCHFLPIFPDSTTRSPHLCALFSYQDLNHPAPIRKARSVPVNGSALMSSGTCLFV